MKSAMTGLLAFAVAVLFVFVVSVAVIGAAPADSHFGNHEQVKIFVQATGNEEGAKKLEEKLNAWLKENADKVEIVARTQSGQQFTTVVTIWYKK